MQLETWFIKEVEKGLDFRYPNGIPAEVRERANYEVGVIAKAIVNREWWNWTPSTFARAIALTNDAPCDVVASIVSSASAPIGEPAYEWTK